MQYMKIQPQSFLGSREEDIFMCVLLYTGMVAILYNGTEPFEIFNTLLKEGLM